MTFSGVWYERISANRVSLDTIPCTVPQDRIVRECTGNAAGGNGPASSDFKAAWISPLAVCWPHSCSGWASSRPRMPWRTEAPCHPGVGRLKPLSLRPRACAGTRAAAHGAAACTDVPPRRHILAGPRHAFRPFCRAVSRHRSVAGLGRRCLAGASGSLSGLQTNEWQSHCGWPDAERENEWGRHYLRRSRTETWHGLGSCVRDGAVRTWGLHLPTSLGYVVPLSGTGSEQSCL